MKLKLRKDLVIPAGTEFSREGVPISTEWGASIVRHDLPFGANATGNLYVGAEVGDAEFDEWFEQVPEAPAKVRAAKH